VISATRQVGAFQVHPIGLGCGSFGFRDGRHDADSIRTLHAALDAGLRFFDTALAYTTLDETSHGERLLAEALRTHPNGKDAVLATKGGHWRQGEHDFPKCGRPEVLREHCEISLAATNRETIDLYQLHWPDPETPFVESVGALHDLQCEGKIRFIGLSNVSVAQISSAQSVARITSVQNHFSPIDQSDREVLDYCTENGIAYLAYSPLGHVKAKDLASYRPDLADIAAECEVTVQRAAHAWLLGRSARLIPLVGASRPATVQDSAAAAELFARTTAGAV
jgi:aryl-alcohol dehydrogenase-like predicted oxidoreductase